ncbi:MAG TPA: hypothetical protein VM597_23495, partial [Gemmataceae bacterium]|nr:hypothetical protein [Gemmataceae bacterium]
ELRRLPLGPGGIRTLAFSPDGKRIAGGGDRGTARVWDADTGKEVLAPAPNGYRVRSVAFSPDGKTVAAAGDVLRLYDLETGKERLKIDRQAIGLHFSADGKVLTGAVTGTIYRWDAATGWPLTPDGAGESPVDQVLVTSDGRRLITRGQDGDAHVWDTRTGAHVRRFQATWQRGLALSPDGRFLVWPAEEAKVQFKDPAHPNVIHTGNRLRLYDLTTDAFVDRFPAFHGDAQMLAFSPDGKQLMTVDHRDGGVRVWDVATGKELRSFRAVPEGRAARSHDVWRAALSPDGRTLAVTYQPVGHGFFSPFAVRLWDVAAGAERHDLGGHFYYATAAFSPDSRFVVTASQPLQQFAREQLKRPLNQVFVWDVATGQRVAALPDGLPTGAEVAAFTPDGLTLALATPTGTVEIWETSTWTKRTEYRGHRDRVNSLAFGPDGRLYTGGLDTTVLAWDTRPPAATDGPLAAAWDALSGPNADLAYKAQGRLLGSPAEAVTLLAEKVKPVPVASPERLSKLIADLDSRQFAVREKATKELESLGWAAAAALREAKLSSSEEVAKRAGDLLAGLDKASPPVSALRAVEVLRWVGTPESRAVLQELAKGAAEAPVTRSATTR